MDKLADLADLADFADRPWEWVVDWNFLALLIIIPNLFYHSLAWNDNSFYNSKIYGTVEFLIPGIGTVPTYVRRRGRRGQVHVEHVCRTR